MRDDPGVCVQSQPHALSTAPERLPREVKYMGGKVVCFEIGVCLHFLQEGAYQPTRAAWATPELPNASPTSPSRPLSAAVEIKTSGGETGRVKYGLPTLFAEGAETANSRRDGHLRRPKAIVITPSTAPGPECVLRESENKVGEKW